MVPAAVASAITVVLTFLASYLVKDRQAAPTQPDSVTKS